MGHKVLIVDDEQEIRQFLDLVLRGKGYDVVTAAGGREGLDRARAEKPDLLLLDLMMPEIDGWAVLKQLKEDGETSRIPVAILSARSEPWDLARALQEGAVDYIAKPFSLQDLLGRVEVILRLAGADAAELAGDEA